MTIWEIMDIVVENDFNVTFSGGDPFYQDPETLTALAQMIHEKGYTLWCYTGFLYEELREIPLWEELLSTADVLVDGPFIQAQRDISLRFRGSANQRIIPLH